MLKGQGPYQVPRRPRITVPANATDCHFHIVGPQDSYPFPPDKVYVPTEALTGDYDIHVAPIGIERRVIVATSAYRLDNRRIESALAEWGRHRTRAVATLGSAVSTAEISRLHDLGFRAVRIFEWIEGGNSLADLETLSAKVAPFGWHVELCMSVEHLSDLKARVRKLPVDVVFDHMGFMPVAVPMDHPGRKSLIELLGEGKSWVKLSSQYRLTAEGPPRYADVAPIARALIQANPDRVVWGTDWPHPMFQGPLPNAGDLIDSIALWTDDAAIQRRILVDNPATLYDF